MYIMGETKEGTMVIRKKLAPLNPDFDKLYTSIADSFDISDVSIRVLVLGPDLNNDGLGSELRKHIVQKCGEDKFIVVLAEHKQIQELYLKILGPIHDLCKMEFHLAVEKDKNHGHDLIDGIIILPDSAGSLVELGMFVFEEQIHSKMLILFNKQYEPTITESFVGNGAKMAFDNGRRAITKIMDYEDLHSSWSEVSEFLELIRKKKMWNTWKKRITLYG